MDIVRTKDGKNKSFKFELNGVGRWIVDEIFYSQAYTPRINRKLDFKIKPADIVIDIGANVGIFSIFAANMACKGKIYSFEPVKDNYNKLKYHIKLNGFKNIVIENKGVSDKRKKAKIYLIDENIGGHSMNKNKFDLLGETEKRLGVEMIDCITLKEIFDKYKIKKCDFLKIDCEGEEFKILHALPRNYFKRIGKISLEFHSPVIDEMKLAKHLHKQGFSVTISNFGEKLGMIFAKNRSWK